MAVGSCSRLVAESDQVEPHPGPVAIVLVVGPERTRWAGRLTTVVAIQGSDQQQSHEDHQKCAHGSNYVLD